MENPNDMIRESDYMTPDTCPVCGHYLNSDGSCPNEVGDDMNEKPANISAALSPITEFYRKSLGDFGTMLELVKNRQEYAAELSDPSDEWRKPAIAYHHACMALYSDPLYLFDTE